MTVLGYWEQGAGLSAFQKLSYTIHIHGIPIMWQSTLTLIRKDSKNLYRVNYNLKLQFSYFLCIWGCYFITT